jgi:hypothetical protein
VIETAVRARVLAEVAALGDRFYPVKLPQEPTLPAITYRRLSPGASDMTLDGPGGLKEPRIRLDVWDTSFTGARAIAEAVKTALNGFRGVCGDQELQGVFLAAEQDLYEDDTELHRVLLEFSVWGEE